MDAPLWKLLLAAAEPEAEKPSAEAVRAAVEEDPGAAARPFATPAGWKPVEGALVRLRPGLSEKHGLRASELATVTEVDSDGNIELERNGEELDGYFEAADLVHGFDGWLPLHAAAALALDKAALLLVLEAHSAAAATADAGELPLAIALAHGASDDAAMVLAVAAPDAVGSDGHMPLHLMIVAKKSNELVQRVLEAHPAAAATPDAAGKYPLHLAASARGGGKLQEGYIV